MNRFAVLLTLFAAAMFSLIAMTVSGSVRAADLTTLRQHERPATPAMLRAEGSPFRPSKRAQGVWNGRACWSACQSSCAWGEAFCLTIDTQGRCLQYTDRCDRVCQSDCRSWGGPLLGFVD